MPPEVSTPLKSRSYIGLVVAQFLAGFNDQAIHFFAIFYAADMLIGYVGLRRLDFKGIVSIVTACFILPFFVFSPLAGVLADKFSKRNTIVFWKRAEIGIMGVAFVGFLLPHVTRFGWGEPRALAVWSSVLVVSTVFMMGMHSTFFTPAKYGIMPEILHPSVLSRGNGLLEGLSFTGQILGTVFGGLMYGQWQSKYDHPTRTLELGHEWVFGLILLGLAVIGAVASQLMDRVPAADADRPLSWQPWGTLRADLALLKRSRSLILATVGISFFTFMTLFIRQTLIFEGETAKEFHNYQQKLAGSTAPAPHHLGSPDRRAEFRVAMLIAFVGLGVGMGCAAAGFISGDRIELGLVPCGAMLIVLLTAALAWVVPHPWGTRIGLVAVGSGAGLYIVPLYTLLQHRAPKNSKGSLVALSNFLNVTGGLIAVAVFFFITFALQSLFGLSLSSRDIELNRDKLHDYVLQLQTQMQIPRLLFLSGSLITLVMLYLLCRQRPDFLIRALSWFRTPGRRHLHTAGMKHLPSDGRLILATNCHATTQWVNVNSAIDRNTRFLRPDAPGATDVDDPLLEWLGRRLGVLVGPAASASAKTASLSENRRGLAHFAMPGEQHVPVPLSADGSRKGSNDTAEWNRMVDLGVKTLEEGNVIGLALDNAEPDGLPEKLLRELQERAASPILPVYCGWTTSKHRQPAESEFTESSTPARRRPAVVIGQPLMLGASLDQIRQAIESLASHTAEK
jgi:acyl-[acyl-carrier-protein]-phospholipid O-acyltransferase/long-chain-fatty-acid--[acyl-carrier-protein] ligase